MTFHASYFMRRFFVYPCVIAAIAILPALRAGAADTSTVSPVDQIQFQQKNAQVQMQELEERMFRLAELTREGEPDDASRLLMAVQRAREQLIIEQMKDSLQLLATKDFTKASTEQVQIIAKLEELKKLLTSGNSDLQVLLAKLRALNQAISKLDAATKEEQRQQKASDKLADAAKSNPADPKAADAAKKDQEQNRKTTESIAQTVKGLGASAAQAGQSLGSASQSMANAEAALGTGKPGDAMTKQGDAVASMQEARKQLAEEREKVMMELERMVRKQVVMNLTEMLDRQKSIRAGTEMAVEQLASANRDTLLKIKQLGASETSIVRIAEQTITLIEETSFSVALPPALKRVQQKCAVIAATLDDSKADQALIAAEIQVEKDLKDLLDTFKELSASKVTPGSCQGCKGDKNKLTAELRVVRLMQTRVNDETKSVDGDRTKTLAAADLPANINPMLREKILAVRDGQADVRDAMDRIHQQLNAPDPAPEEQPQ